MYCARVVAAARARRFESNKNVMTKCKTTETTPQHHAAFHVMSDKIVEAQKVRGVT